MGWFLAFGYISVSAFEAISIGKIASLLSHPSTGGRSTASMAIPSMEATCCWHWGCRIDHLDHYIGVQELHALSGLPPHWLFDHCGRGSGALFYKKTTSATWGIFHRDGNGSILGGIIAVFATVPFLAGERHHPGGRKRPGVCLLPHDRFAHRGPSIVAAVLIYILLIISTSMVGNWQSVGRRYFTAKAFELAFRSKLLSMVSRGHTHRLVDELEWVLPGRGPVRHGAWQDHFPIG